MTGTLSGPTVWRMPLITVLVVLVVVGVLLWAVQTVIPMDAKIKQIITVVAIVSVCLWLLSLFVPGLGGLMNIRIGR